MKYLSQFGFDLICLALVCNLATVLDDENILHGMNTQKQ
mgnify:CR=1 FL=1